MIRACIFDLDGTLLYTLEAIAKAANTALSELGYPPQPVEDYRYYCGDGADTLVRRVLDLFDDRDPEHFRLMCARNRELLGSDPDYRVVSYPHLPETLARLKERGVLLAVCSNKPHSAAVDTIRHYFGEDLFDCVQGQADGMPVKPDPAMAEQVMKTLSVRPEECLYFGDTATDMRTARNARITAVGVLWGYRDRTELVDGGAQILLEDPSEIEAVCGRIGT